MKTDTDKPKGKAENAAANAIEAQPNDTEKGPQMTEVTLVEPIIRGDLTIDKITLRRPKSGDLRGGLNLSEIQQCDVDAILKIIPRISQPALNEDDCLNLDPEDLMEIGGSIYGFFMTKVEREQIAMMKEQAQSRV